MPSVNRVFLAGNLTRDPEVRRLPSGSAVAKLGLAINRKFRTKSGEDKDDTCFVDIEAWERQAELCEQYLRKGAPILVEGSLRYDQWESKTGEKRSRLVVRADRIEFLGRPDRPQASQPDPVVLDDGSAEPPARGRPEPAHGPDAAADKNDPDEIPF